MLPVVKPEIAYALNASGYDQEALIERIVSENPEIARLLVVMEHRDRRDAMVGVLVLYRLLAAQADADALKELLV